jgi:hypothetical protein
MMKNITPLTKIEKTYIRQLIKKCGLRIQHISVLLGESRQTIFFDFSDGTISETRLNNYRYLIEFLENLYQTSNYFKKSVRETGRMAAVRRHSYAQKLNKQFANFIQEKELQYASTAIAK